MDAVGAQHEAIAGAHRDRQHVDPQRLVLEADEGGEPVQGHAALTVLADVEAGRQEFRPHVVVVGEQVEAGPVVEVGESVGAGVAEVDQRDQRAADDRDEKGGPEAIDAALAAGADARRR